MKTFKALSLLLSYPQDDLMQAVPAIRAALREEGLIGPHRLGVMEPLLASLAKDDIYDLQERYVLLFDRSRSLSLNLFEHIHGESRDRGGAMVDLLETYRAGGFDLQGPELPDHLPVLLEFLSTRTLEEARGILADAGHILVALAERLTRRQSVYAGVLETLVALAEVRTDTDEAAALLAEAEDDPTDLVALDKVWEEAQVTFAPDPNAGCPISRDILARMDIAPRTAAE
jgi:nitrate reductase delta subunit